VNARDVLNLAWLIPALPLLGAALLLLFGKRIGEPKSGWIATLLMALTFVVSLIITITLHGQSADARAHVVDLFDWFHAGTFQVKLGFLVDPLSTTFICFITGVATLIHVYSIGYMHGDPRYSRFFAYLNLFAASMLVLVLGSNFLVTFLGWEGVGVCSYLLVSFWFERPSAATAGKKAFVTNRVGDFGFMLAMFLIFANLGTLNYSALGAAHALSPGTATAIALLLFLGAAGKSAQLPLHIWLPDAMEGPTPVSALIHAATMVTAGIYLVARAHAFFVASGGAAATTVVWVGALTALYAASVAVMQNDIKRVLAYSTVSQLGYMFMALGSGAYAAAIFLVIAHAFFKATLFLGSGSVIHSMDENQDIRIMGGLRKYMPITAGAFGVAWLAIAGVPPFAGFWAKDDILGKVFAVHLYPVWVIGLVTAGLTAFYMTREVLLVFGGNERFRAEAPEGDGDTHAAAEHDPLASPTIGPDDPPKTPTMEHDPHEAPPTMVFPVVILGILAVVGGLLSLPFKSIEFLTDWLEPVFRDSKAIAEPSFARGTELATISVVLGLAGIALGFALYRNGLKTPDGDPLPSKLGEPVSKLLAHAYYLDDGLAKATSGPVTDGANWLAEDFDQGIIDGAVNGIGALFMRLGRGLGRLQNGRVRNYALGMILGSAALLVYLVAWAARS
jgi:NADH-quinone oxidoreductase subunit L